MLTARQHCSPPHHPLIPPSQHLPPPHVHPFPTRRSSDLSMHRRAARTPISVEELVAYIGSPPRNSGRFSSVENLRSTPRLETVLMSSGESLYIMAAISSVVLTAFGGVEVAEAMRLIISTPVGSVGG